MVINVIKERTTMKKSYIQPSVMVVLLHTKTHLLNGSPTPKFSPNQTTSTMDAKGGFGGWDDDVEPGEDY